MTSSSQKLAEIMAKGVEVRDYLDGHKKIFVAELPYIRPFTAEHEPNDEMVFLNKIEVPEELRNHGIASRLIGALATHLVASGHDRITTLADSPYTLKIFRRQFGVEALSLYTPQGEELDKTVDEAITLLSENLSSNTHHQVGVDVDLD